MNDYIPFDFGTWRQIDGLDCFRHGMQDGGPVFNIQPHVDEKATVRRYCGLCIMEALDRVCTHD